METATLKNGQNGEATATLGQNWERKEAVVSDPPVIDDVRLSRILCRRGKEEEKKCPALFLYYLLFLKCFPLANSNGKPGRQNL